jgi:hypothetical protein
MRRVHPLWRGFFLACALTAALVLAGGPDSTAAFRSSSSHAKSPEVMETPGLFVILHPGRRPFRSPYAK